MIRFLAEEGGEAAAGIAEIVSGFISEYLIIGVTWLLELPWFLQALIVAFLALVIVCGLIFLVTKLWKVLIVIAVLGVVAFLVYNFLIKDKLGGEVPTDSIATANVAFDILKAYL